MAEVDIIRQARRKRILENSDNRFGKITGKYKENIGEEKFNNDKIDSKSEIKNNFIPTDNITTIKKHLALREKKINFIEQDDSSKFIQSHVQFQQLNNHFILDHSDYQYSFQNTINDCDNLHYNSTVISVSQVFYKQLQYLFSNLFFRSLSYIFLAVFINILSILNINFLSCKSILTPYIIMSITYLCLGNKFKKIQGNSLLMTMLILCNIKPEILHNIKQLLTLCSTSLNDFALYLTSFVLFNWIIFLCGINLNHIQFY